MVKVPAATVDAASIVAQGAGNLVASGGGNIVAQGGGNLVAQGGGNLVAQGGGNYRIWQAQPVATDLPVLGAIVTLRDPLTRKRLRWVPPVQTDATGAFRFEQLPTRLNYLVEVDFVTKAGKTPFRMASIGKATPEAIPVTWCSSAMIGTMMTVTNSESTGLLVGDIPPQVIVSLSQMMTEAYKDLSAADLTAKQKQAIAADATSIKTETDGAVSLMVPDALAGQEMGSAGKVMLDAAPRSAALKGVMDTMGERAAPPSDAELRQLVRAGQNLGELEKPPALVDGQFELAI
jgi:hypothetical protein